MKRSRIARKAPTPRKDRPGPLRAPRKPTGRVPPRSVASGEAEWKAVRWGRCQNCGIEGRLVLHHVVEAAFLSRAGLPVYDLRNGMALGAPDIFGGKCACHSRHTSAFQRIPLERVPVAAKQFAYDTLGPAAIDYLARRYSK